MASMGVEGVDLLFYSMTWDWKAMKVGEMEHFLTSAAAATPPKYSNPAHF